jgi:hypothetical protein
MDQLRFGRVVSRKGRQATFEKRRADLFQKASDLSKMCDVRLAVVVYDPRKAEPATWPPEPAEAAGILLRQKAEKLRCRELNMLNLAERARINHYHMNHGSFLLHQKILNSDPCIYRQPQVS